MQNDKIGEIKNKFIYNNKNACLSIPLLMMSARRMNLCREEKEKKVKRRRNWEREKSGHHPVWAKQQKPNEQQQQQQIHSSVAVWESRWPSWAVRPNEPSGFTGRKELLNRASALVTTCP